MKIEVITKYFYPVAAGIETNILETYSILAKEGHEVTIHTSRDNYLEKDSLPKEETIRGLKVKRYQFKSELTGYMPKIDWDKTDFVCLHNFNVSHFPILAKIIWMKLRGKKNFKVIITPHGGFNPEWRVFDWPTRVKKYLYQYTIGTLTANIAADGFRAVSEWEKREMIKRGISKSKISVITNGLENEAYEDVDKKASGKIKKQVKNYGDYIIQIGRVYPIKNYETTIRALPLIDKKINYVIVGQTQDTKYLETLKKLALELGVEKRVIFAGIVRGIDKYYLIKKAKLMVHMAIWESFCNVVHEGLSQGLICLVADNTALPLLVKNGENGFTIKTKDYKTLAEKINYVLENFNAEDVKEMRENNKKIAQNESWSAVSTKMESFYTGLNDSSEKKKESKVPKKWSNTIIKILVSLFAVIVLALAVRGNYGNPTPKDLQQQSWRDNGPFELSPERGRFSLLYSIVEDRSFHFSVDLANFTVPDLGYINGKYVSLFAPGVSFLAIPGYIIGEYFNASQVGVYGIIGLFALINFILVRKIAVKLGANEIAAVVGGLIFLFATPAFTYGVNFYQHHISTFLILFAIYLVQRPANFWSLTGIWFLCAMSIPIDYPNLFLMFPIGIFATAKLIDVKRLENKISISANFWKLLSLVSVIIPLGFFLWFNQMSYGNPLQFSGTVASVFSIDPNGNPTAPRTVLPTTENVLSPDEQEKSALKFFESRAILNGLYIHFFSPDRGVVYFTPVILLGIIGLFVLYKYRNKYLSMFLGVIGANIFLYSMWGDPWGGWAFGSRYLIPTYSILAIVIGVALTKFNKKLWFTIPLTLLMIYSVGVNTLGALTSNRVPPKEEAKLLENITNRQERFSFDRSWELLSDGKSKSFVFQTWLDGRMTSMEYFYMLFGSISVVTTLLIVIVLFTKNEEAKS